MTVSRWDDHEAEAWPDDLGQRVYTSRLLGQDPDLVLHGGGNTSVKTRRTDIFGEEVEVLLVKGSGADLSEVDRSGFASLDLARVRRLARLDALSDTAMAEQLLLSATAPGPAPSVEAILHAVVPHRFVDHTHADAVLTVTNSPGAEAALAEIYGDRVLVVPYVMPGFLLARACAAILASELRPDVVGMVLLKHGIFSWGDSAREAYESMIELVSRAEEHVSRRLGRAAAPAAAADRQIGVAGPLRRPRAELRLAVSRSFGAPVVLSSHTDTEVTAFIGRADLEEVSQKGPLTPDHVIRTKAWPLVGRDVDAFAARYRRYFDDHSARADGALRALDPAPRVVLDPELGMACVGRTPGDARIVEDVYRHTMRVISDAAALGGYEPVSEAELFDVEYWELEQAKLARRGAPPPLAGEVALVTGAAGGIGRACADALLHEGCAVVGMDVDAGVIDAFPGPSWLGRRADVTDPAATAEVLEAAAERFGGLDVLVLNAGVFPPGAPIARLDDDIWRRAMSVNLDANLALLREAHPLLRAAPRGGRVVVIGSKNVPAPGPAAAAYSASKAAATQLARVAALEWAADGIRVNVIHPNAVFDTALWSDEVLAERAASYGLTVEAYRRHNLLGVEVSSADVARMCLAMCGPAFARTTGAQVPVDGGNERVV